MAKIKRQVHTTPSSTASAFVHKSTEWVFQFWAWQLLVWSLYRYFFKFPEPIDEFIVKPIVFILPVLFFVWRKEKRSFSTIGITMHNFTQSILIGLGFGLLFSGEAMFANIMKYGSLTISATPAVVQNGIPLLVVLSLATAISEEVLSRGFFFSRLFESTKNMLYSALMSTLLFVAFHIPILLTSLKFQGTTLILFFLTSFILGLTNSFMYHKNRSLVAPILIHLFWNMTVSVFL
jgi:membrane protease YdiL (CAAX protease family)